MLPKQMDPEQISGNLGTSLRLFIVSLLEDLKEH